MPIEPVPFDSVPALTVFRNLDKFDAIEAGLVRGQKTHHLDLFADWRSVQQGAVLSLVLNERPAVDGGRPFAVLCLAHTGQAGVAQAAMLSRSHGRFARALRRAAREIRRELPGFCASNGIHRVEARCWRLHPTAARFLTFCGFSHEADLPGFGRNGNNSFAQYAWVQPDGKGD